MTQDEKAALIAERTELQRVYLKLQQKGGTGYLARTAAYAKRIEEVDARLDTPEPMPVGIDYSAV